MVIVDEACSDAEAADPAVLDKTCVEVGTINGVIEILVLVKSPGHGHS